MPTAPLLAYVTGAAQGHYRVLPDERSFLRLRPSPHFPTLVGGEPSAAAVLAGATLDDARALIRGAAK
jgi:hypothetical protein